MSHNENKNEVVTGGLLFASTILGGPIAGFYFLYKNSQAIKDGKEKVVLYSGISATVAVIIVTLLLTTLSEEILDKIPNTLIPISYIVPIILYYKKEQKQKVLNLLVTESDTQKYSKLKMIGISLLSTIIFFVIVFILYVTSYFLLR